MFGIGMAGTVVGAIALGTLGDMVGLKRDRRLCRVVG